MPSYVQKQLLKIDELAVLVDPQNRQRKVFGMIKAYLDESGIHDGSPICLIAGYFGGVAQLGKLEEAWKKVLSKFDFPMKDFHTKDLIKLPVHWPMLFALAEAVAKQGKVYPVSYGIVVDDFLSLPLDERRFLTGATLMVPSATLKGVSRPRKPYFVPFQGVIKIVTDAAPVGGKAHFAFGLDTSFSGYANALFKQLHKTAALEKPEYAHDWKSRDRLGIPTYPLAAETAELQAADLLVHARYLQWNSPDRSRPPKHVDRILRGCLGNSRDPSDHLFQDLRCLRATLDKVRAKNPNWHPS